MAVRHPGSRYDVGDDPVLEQRQPIFHSELLLLHTLDLKRVAACGDHRIDRCVKVEMFLLQACKLKTNLGLFLFRHVFRLQNLRVLRAPLGGSGGKTLPACRHSTFPPLGKCYYLTFDFGLVRWQNVTVPSWCVVNGGKRRDACNEENHERESQSCLLHPILMS